MIEYDRLEKLRERRLSGTGAGNSQVTPSSFSDSQTIDKVREERLNRINSVAETEFSPQTEVKKKENSDVAPNKDASWWSKTKEFLQKYNSPADYVKEKVSPTVESIKEDIKFGIKNPMAVAKEVPEVFRQTMGVLPKEEKQKVNVRKMARVLL